MGSQNVAGAFEHAGRPNVPMTFPLQSRRGSICARGKHVCRVGEPKESVLLLEQLAYYYRVFATVKKKRFVVDVDPKAGVLD